MTAIFISHSSADNNAALDMKAWLERQGHTSLFLDFDPEAGIRAGGDWEETIYYKLRQCQAVVALLTPSWLASKWCFAELVQAREKGKAIFPVKVQPCDTSLFCDVQHIDLTAKPEEGYRRLAIGLRERGLDPLDVFDWDPKRPPYPGLLAFQEDDAAIFFGRGEEILNGLETLDALRRRGRGAPRFVLFLGASGSGKSSLVRAGLIPRLKKTPSEWLPLAPFRPQDDPFDELAIALADKFEALGRPQNWAEIGQKLKTAAEEEPADGKALLRFVRELTIIARRREATVVLTIDQAEELFGYSLGEAASRFWCLLRAALEASDRQLLAVATMRSDFLGEFQAVRALHDPAYDHDFAYQAVPVDPMPERNFVQIIRGPARLAGLRLEDGLVEAMVGDTATRDALPLLAFTLRRLYDRYGEDGLLEIREYEDLGRLEGSIREEANRVLREAKPSPEDLEALRAAFVPTMVRISAGGNYARQRAHADEIPHRARKSLRRFIDAHLLISDRDQDGRETVEVAHEALLRAWPQLSVWLAEDQDKLRLLESIRRAAEEWDGGGKPADLLVHRDGRLKDAQALATNRRFAVRENSPEKRYLDACAKAQQAREAAEREEQERRVRDAERIAEEQKKAASAQKKTAQRTLVGLVAAVLLAIASGVAGWVAYQNSVEANDRRLEADTQREVAVAEVKKAKVAERKALTQESRALAALAQSETKAGYPVEGMLLALRGMPIDEERDVVTETRQALVDAMLVRREALFLSGHQGRVWDAGFSPDGARIVSASNDGTVRVWDAASGAELLVLRDHGETVWSAEFSSDGARIVSAGDDEAVRVSDAASGAERLILRPQMDFLRDADFSPDGTRIVSANAWGLKVWDAASGAELLAVDSPSLDSFGGAAFSPDGARIVTFGDHTVRVWDAASGAELLVVRGHERNAPVEAAEFSPDGARIVSASNDGTVRVWDAASGAELLVLDGHEGWVGTVALSPDGTRIASGSHDHTVRVWDTATGEELMVLRGHQGPVNAVGFSSDGARIVSAADDGTVRVWDAASRPELLLLDRHDAQVSAAAFSPNGARIVTAPYGHGAMPVWDAATGEELLVLRRHETGVIAAKYSPDGARIVSASADETVRVWDAATGEELMVLRGHEGFVWAAGFSPDGARIVSAGDDWTVRVWDAVTGKELMVLRGHGARVSDAEFSPDGARIASASDDGRVRVWDAASGAELMVLRGQEGRVMDADFSLDGARIVSAAQDIRVWDAATGEERLILPGHGSRFTNAGFSPDGGRIVSASYDSTVRVWDAASGAELLVLPGHRNAVNTVAFSPDGARIVSAGDDWTVRVWFVGKDDADLVTYACAALPRDLSPEAIKRFNLGASWPCGERAQNLWPHPQSASIQPAVGPDKAGASSAAR